MVLVAQRCDIVDLAYMLCAARMDIGEEVGETHHRLVKASCAAHPVVNGPGAVVLR